MWRMFLNLLERLGLRKREDFVSRVLRRHRQNAPVSDFARELARSQTAEMINDGFARARRNATGGKDGV